MLQRVAALLGAAKPEAHYAICPCCATPRILALNAESPGDRAVRTAWSALQQRFGGTRYHCGFCQVQFYDCRKRIARVQPIHELVVRQRTGFVTEP